MLRFTHCFSAVVYLPLQLLTHWHRPDVLTKYTVKVTACKQECPVLLSNGNLCAQGDLEGGRHYAIFIDPFPKPTYLFALVAGDLSMREDTFVTKSGKTIDLRIYVQPPNADRTAHALESLKLAMAWDEQRFGLEYDLEVFNIVAVDDFNMVS